MHLILTVHIARYSEGGDTVDTIVFSDLYVLGLDDKENVIRILKNRRKWT